MRLAGTGAAGCWSTRRRRPRSALRCDMADVRPALDVLQRRRRGAGRRGATCSRSGRFAAEFVVETEDDGRAVLRFGDGVERPRAAGRRRRSTARYASATASAGNVGADAIVRAGDRDRRHHARAQSAAGGRRRRSAAAVAGAAVRAAGLPAPGARGHRRPTTRRWPSAIRDVQRAVATRRWTGSWYTMFVTVDRRGGDARRRRVRSASCAHFLERYRLAGHDVEIDAPRFVAARHRAATSAPRRATSRPTSSAACSTSFSARALPDGSTRLLPPRQRSRSAQPVYLSAIDRRARCRCRASRTVDAGALPAARPQPAQSEIDDGAHHRWRGSRSRGSTTTRTRPRTAASSSTCDGGA